MRTLPSKEALSSLVRRQTSEGEHGGGWLVVVMSSLERFDFRHLINSRSERRQERGSHRSETSSLGLSLPDSIYQVLCMWLMSTVVKAK